MTLTIGFGSYLKHPESDPSKVCHTSMPLDRLVGSAPNPRPDIIVVTPVYATTGHGRWGWSAWITHDESIGMPSETILHCYCTTAQIEPP